MPKLSLKPKLLSGADRELLPGEVRAVGGTGPASDAFRGGWFFEPLQPTTPLAPAAQRPRRFEYVPGHNLIWTPREGIGVSFGTLRTLSYALDVVRVVIEEVKAAIRGLEWEIRLKRKIGERRFEFAQRSQGDKTAAAIKEYLQFPDGRQSFDAWLNEGIEEILVTDGWSIYLERDSKGNIANLKTLGAETIVPLVDVEGFTPRPPTPAYYQTLYGTPAFLLTTDDLIYACFNRVIRGPNEFSLYGYPPVEQVLLTINQLLRNEQFALSYFSEGTLPEALAGVPSTWTQAQIEQLQNWFDSVEAGNSAQRRRLRFIPTVAGGAGERMNIVFPKVNDVSFKGEYPELLIRIITAAFRVSQQAFVKMMSRASSEEASALSEEVGTSSWTKHIENTITAIIQQKIGFTEYEFAFRSRTESDPKKLMEVNTGYVKVGTVTQNEIREDLGRDPYDDPRAGQPMVITATGPVPLFPDESQAAPPSPDGPKQLPPKPDGQGPKPDGKENPENVGKRRRPRIEADEANPLLSRARMRMESAVKRAGHEIQRRVLESRHLDRLQKAEGDNENGGMSTEEAELVVAAILVNMENYYAKRKEEFEQALADAGKAGIIVGTREGAVLPPAEQRKLAADAEKWASDHVAELVTGIDDTTRDRLRTILTRALEDGTPFGELEREISAAGTFSDARARMIARTEVGNAMIRSNLETWKQSGAAEYVEWLIGDDPCPVCELNDGEVRKIGDAFPSGDDSPLVHPNCECSLVGVDAPDLERVEKAEKKSKSKTGTVYLMRHGATLLNEQHRLRGWSSIPLDAQGRKTVTKSAEELGNVGIRKIVSSKIRRAKESASIVGKILKVPVEQDDELNAWNIGTLAGQPVKTIQPYIEDRDAVPPNGESLNDFRKRAVKAVGKYAKDARDDGPTLLVAHNSLMLAVKQAVDGREPKENEPDPVTPGGVMEYKQRKLRRIVGREIAHTEGGE